MMLETFFAQHPKLAIAFSGGADSAYLLWRARACGADAAAFFLHSAFQPDFELEDARRLCGELNVKLHVLERDVLALPELRENSPERCYHCKKLVFSAIREAAEALGYRELADGSNASDDAADRPGMRALGELGVLSPLRLCGITKQELRRLSREAGLFTADKPAYACLATRIPTGEPLTREALERVHRGEQAIAKLGFSDFRLRTEGKVARLELLPEQLPRARALEAQLCALLPDFEDISFAQRQRRD